MKFSCRSVFRVVLFAALSSSLATMWTFAYDIADSFPPRIFLLRLSHPRLPLHGTLPETIIPDGRRTPSLDRTKLRTPNAAQR